MHDKNIQFIAIKICVIRYSQVIYKMNPNEDAKDVCVV